MTSLPPGKYYWPGAESHEAYTEKKFVLHTQKLINTNKKYTVFSSESHSSKPIVPIDKNTQLYKLSSIMTNILTQIQKKMYCLVQLDKNKYV